MSASEVPGDAATSKSEPAIEAHDGPIDESEFEPSIYESGSSIGASTSLASSLYEHEMKHGRSYHQFRHGRYPIPNDESEQSRDDLKHTLVLELLDGKLILSPISENPQKILDVGTGTGAWAIAVADENPSAVVTGVDLSPIQPSWIPPNCKFLVDDVEDDLWLQGSDYDLIFFRGMATALRDLPRAARNAFENLRPGGWVEWQDWSGEMFSDDGTMPEDSYSRQFYQICGKALAKFGMDLYAGKKHRSIVEEAGFVNITCKEYKVPLGRWPKDPRLRLIGMYYQLVMEGMIPAITAKPMHALGWTEDEIAVFAAKCRESFRDTKQHIYTKWLVCTAQKPEQPATK